jgi:WD40 repeat protein
MLMLVGLAAIVFAIIVAIVAGREPTTRWVGSISFSPNGKQIATNTFRWRSVQVYTPAPKVRRTDVQQVAEVIDLANGKNKVLARGNTDRSRWVAIERRVAGMGVQFLPDGKAVAVAVWQGQVEFHDPVTGSLVGRFPGRNDGQGDTTIEFAADGSFFVAAGWGTADVCDIQANRRTTRICVGEKVNMVALTPDGKGLVSVDDCGRVILWDVATGQRRRAYRDELSWDVFAVAISPDGGIVAAGLCDDPPGVQLWRASDGEKLTFVEASHEVRALSFSPNGKTLAVADVCSCLLIIDVATGRVRMVDDGSRISAVAFSPDGVSIATGDICGRVTVRDAATLEQVRSYRVGGPYRTFALHWAIPSLALLPWIIVWIRIRRRSGGSR